MNRYDLGRETRLTIERLLLIPALLLAVASLRCPSKATVSVTGRPALPEADLWPGMAQALAAAQVPRPGP